MMNEPLAEAPYRIVYEDYPNYLYALVHSEQYGYDVLAGFLREIAEQCKARGYKQVVIEENISATASNDDIVRIATELPQLGFADIRMAYIDRFTDQSEMNEMGKKVAMDHGVDVRLFADQAAADRWLASPAEGTV
jgi:hypothetical protein